MKRITALLICITIIMSMLVSCAKKDDEYSVDDYKDNTGVSDTKDNENTQTEPEKKPEQNKEEKNEQKTEDKAEDNPKDKTEDKIKDKTKEESEDKSEQNNTTDDGKSFMDKIDTSGDGSYIEENNNVNTGDYDSGDTDLGEITFDTSDGEVDTEYENQKDSVTYETSVPTTVAEMNLSKSDYDETKFTFPIIKINTLDNSSITSKTQYKNATISITNTTGAYSLKNHAVEIRGRGNSTWKYFEKKAYKLRFAVKQDLFGMGAGKKWVLLANALDETMLRNYLTLSIAKSLGTEFATDFQFVNLVINGEYYGVYLLCEQVQEGQNRVDINTSKIGEIDTGYLLEGINNSSDVEERTFRLPAVNGKSLGKDNKFQVIIKSPGGLECTDEQYEFIKDYVTKANEAIFTKDWSKIQEYVDIDSFVNLFLVNEISLNNDMGYSFYMYKKKGGKLSIGPVWDYDQAMGSSTHGGSGYKGWYAGSELQWFTTLIKIPEFKALVKSKYDNCSETFNTLVNRIDSIVNKNRYDFAMNDAYWGQYGVYRWRITPDLVQLKSYSEHLTYLKTWLTNRLIWVKDHLD